MLNRAEVGRVQTGSQTSACANSMYLALLQSIRQCFLVVAVCGGTVGMWARACLRQLPPLVWQWLFMQRRFAGGG
eukprot:276792-Chlamydomonas_euryale.AAC.3